MCGSIEIKSGTVTPTVLIQSIFPEARPMGFIKAESIQKGMWNKRIINTKTVPVVRIYEHNTNGYVHKGSKPKGIWFKVKNKGIVVVLVRGFSGELEGRILTVDANNIEGKVSPAIVHDRFPALVNMGGKRAKKTQTTEVC